MKAGPLARPSGRAIEPDRVGTRPNRLPSRSAGLPPEPPAYPPGGAHGPVSRGVVRSHIYPWRPTIDGDFRSKWLTFRRFFYVNNAGLRMGHPLPTYNPLLSRPIRTDECGEGPAVPIPYGHKRRDNTYRLEYGTTRQQWHYNRWTKTDSYIARRAAAGGARRAGVYSSRMRPPRQNRRLSLNTAYSQGSLTQQQGQGGVSNSALWASVVGEGN